MRPFEEQKMKLRWGADDEDQWMGRGEAELHVRFVWPKSFYSSQGKSCGDIQGVISKLDYIKSLGANTLWLSPHYSSPMIDEGYDISDYNDINPDFGTLADAEQLIKECHDRDMRCLFDLVVNHTSDQHKWFKESRSSKDNPKADWYIWRPAKYGRDGKRMPPNNWSSCFSESAWTWDEGRQEYYLHLFCVEQPDLNWTNKDVSLYASCDQSLEAHLIVLYVKMRETIHNSVIRFWMDKGLDGWRCDTINMLSKPMDFPDAPIVDTNSFIQPAGHLYCNGPEIHKYMNEMGKIFNEYDAMTVGELPNATDVKQVQEYVSLAREELSMVFQFDTVDMGRKPSNIFMREPYKLSHFKSLTLKWQKMIQGSDAWTTSFIENHDQGRSISRFANDSSEYQQQSSKMMSLLVLCQSGTPFIYQGQELGMTNIPLDWPESDYLDVNTINYLKKMRSEGWTEDKIKRDLWPDINRLARDNARTPVQWSDEDYAGFSTTKPWMRVNDNYKTINAASQLKDSNSVYHFWQKIISLRKYHLELFTYGDFDVINHEDENVFTFIKTSKSGAKAIVMLNFSIEKQPMKLPEEVEWKSAKKVISTLDHKNHKEALEDLQAYEGRVLIL